MVLENLSVNRLTTLIAIFGIASSAQADISISSAKDLCTVSSEGQSLELQLTPPCSLVKIDAQDRDYIQYDESKVYIVAGKPAPLTQLAKWSVTEEDNCSLQSQALIITDGQARLSAIREEALTCPEIGLDEKVYRDFLK